MDSLRVSIEIGDRRFEAEGPVESVERQVTGFMKFAVGGNAETTAAEGGTPAEAAAQTGKPRVEAPTPARRFEADLDLGRILRVGGSAVWLTRPAKSPSEALLVLLLGQSRLRGLNLVGGTDLMEGMRASGQPVRRVDYFLNTHVRRNHVATDGQRRARRYRLTPAGIQRAEQIARRLIDMSSVSEKP